MKVGELMVEMGADIARLRKDMGDAAKVVGDTGKQISGSLDQVQKMFGMVGMGLSIGALTAWAKASIDAAGKAHDMAQKIGMSVEELSGLNFAMRQSGVESGALQTALVKLSGNVLENEGAFKALGIATKDASGQIRPTKAILSDVADVFSQLPNGITRTKLATELFGKAGADMIPVLIGGSAGLRNMADEAEKIGAVLSTDAAQAADDFGDSLDVLRMKSEAATVNWLSDTLPVLTEIAKQFALTGSSAKDGAEGISIWQEMASTTMEALGVLALNTIYVFRTVAGEIGAIASGAKALMTDGFEGAAKVRDEWIAKSKGMREEVDKQSASVMKARDKQAEMSAALKLGADAAALSAGENRRLGANVNTVALAAANAAIKNKELASAHNKATDEAEKHAAAQKKLKDAGDELTASLSNEIAALDKRIALGRDLTAAETDYIKILEKVRTGKVILTEAELAELNVMLQLRDTRLQQIATEKEYQAALIAGAQHSTKMGEAEADRTAKLRESVVALAAQNAQLGLSPALIAAQTAKVDQDAAAQLEWQAAMEGGNYELEEQARLLRKRAEQAQQGIVVQEAITAAAEWKKTTDQIGQGLTDSLFRAFQDGKNFFKTLWDGIVNTFKTTVLRLAINAVMSPINGAIGTMLGGASTASSASSGLGSLLSTGGSIGSSVASGGSSIGTMAGLTAAASTFAGTAAAGWGLTMAGSTGAALGSAGAMAAGGSMAGAAGMAIGALGPYAIAALAIYAIAKSLSDAGTYHTGGAAMADASGMQQIDWKEIGNKASDSVAISQKTVEEMGALNQGNAIMLQALANVGSGGTIRVGTGFADDTSKDGAFGEFQVMRDGQSLLNWQDSRTSKWAPKVFADAELGKTQFADAIAASMVEVTGKLGLPDWAQKMITDLGPNATLAQLGAATDKIVEQKAALDAAAAAAAAAEATATYQETDLEQGGDMVEYGSLTLTGLETINTSVVSIGDRITAAVDAMRASLEAGLAASIEVAQSTANQLARWDDGDALVTTTVAP